MKVVGRNKQEVYINLPSTLYRNLKEACQDKEDIDIGLAALILRKIITHQSEEIEWVPLHSEILRKDDHGKFKYSRHIEFLEHHELIETLPYQHGIKGKDNSSRKFSIPLQKVPPGDKQEMYFVAHAVRGPLAKKIIKHYRKKKIEAESTTRHLTKWLDSGGSQ